MEEWRLEFNQGLLAHLAQFQSDSGQLNSAIRYALDAPGKRLRPLFVSEASSLAGLPDQASKLLGYAIEMVHVFSLIHDDLPCLDNDDFRRGLPTVHRKFNEATALLAGDGLIPLAYETFASLAAFSEPKAFQNALAFFSKSIGIQGMIGGQTLELEWAEQKISLSLENLLRIQDLKTGALFRASVLTPFYLAGRENTPAFKEALEFASGFGFAFQIADDLEDEIQDQALAAKNILSLLGKEAAIKLALEKLNSSSLKDHFSPGKQLVKKLETALPAIK